MKGLCRRAKAGSSREMMDRRPLARGDDRNHEKGDEDDVDEREDDVLPLLLLLPLLPLPLPLALLLLLLGLTASAEVLVVVGDDDVGVVSLFLDPADDRFQLPSFHLLVLMVRCWQSFP